MALKLTDRFDLTMLEGDGHYTVHVHEVSIAQVKEVLDGKVENYLHDLMMLTYAVGVFGVNTLPPTISLMPAKLGKNDTLIVVMSMGSTVQPKLFAVTIG